MPSMPGTVTKTATFRNMDTIWSADPETRMTEYDAAQDLQTLLNDALNKYHWISPTVANHVIKHWLPHSGYFGVADAADVLQRGLYWAMRVAAFRDGDLTRRRTNAQGQPVPLPICCAWVCSGGKSEASKKRFEVITLESDHQVTLLFLTPPPKGATDGNPASPLQPVWATRRIEFKVYPGEKVLEQWGPPTAKKPTTRTVRPYDTEDYSPPPR
jgi:hypothetical protein